MTNEELAALRREGRTLPPRALPEGVEPDTSDPDNPDAAERLAAVVRGPGRPRSAAPKVFTGIRLDADVLEAFRARGKGWQTHINAALREWLKTHPGA